MHPKLPSLLVLVPALLCLVATFPYSATAATEGQGGLQVGQPFPDLNAAGLVGTLPSPAELRGKVLLVDFWASWCAPCRASFPAYERLHRDFSAQGLVVIGVGIDDKPAAYDAFVKKMKPTFAVVHDRQKKLVETVRVPGMPTAYLVDREGRVRLVHGSCEDEKTERELRVEVQKLLAAKPASAP